MQDMRFQRSEMLLGSEAMRRLAAARVIVFGLGGVGSYVVEALARSGVGVLALVDGDTVDITNINRQIIATEGTVGQPKTEVAARRIESINPYCSVEQYPLFYLPETAGEIDVSRYSYVVDAVDTVTAKLELAVRAHTAGVPVISSMGTGNKLDPTQFTVADIYETSVCPLARVMRRELKQRGIPALKVVYSREQPVQPREAGRTPGSVAFVPPAAGLVLAGAVVRDLTGV